MNTDRRQAAGLRPGEAEGRLQGSPASPGPRAWGSSGLQPVHSLSDHPARLPALAPRALWPLTLQTHPCCCDHTCRHPWPSGAPWAKALKTGAQSRCNLVLSSDLPWSPTAHPRPKGPASALPGPGQRAADGMRVPGPGPPSLSPDIGPDRHLALGGKLVTLGAAGRSQGPGGATGAAAGLVSPTRGAAAAPRRRSPRSRVSPAPARAGAGVAEWIGGWTGG